jgi:hypothetical protein
MVYGYNKSIIGLIDDTYDYLFIKPFKPLKYNRSKEEYYYFNKISKVLTE